MAENNEKSIEERLKELREDAKAGIKLEEESGSDDEMKEQTRQKFKRLIKRV